MLVKPIFMITALFVCFRLINTFTATKQITKSSQNQPKICDGNRFKHISTYALGLQNDLNLTFNSMQKNTHVDKVIYKDQLFRTYTIFSLNLTFQYSQGMQTAKTIGTDKVQISGGILRISYKFSWQKKQFGSSIQGTGSGAVKTDPISFIKSLTINNQTKQFQWNFVSAQSIKISNSLTLNDFKPYKVADYDVINQMLNQLKSGQPTVKIELIKGLNANFTTILKKIVHQNTDTWKQPQKIFYTYTDYHGEYSIVYDNVMLNSSLANGLDLLLSQSIQNDTKFQCGQKVPTDAQDQRKYGGLQQFISITFIKSTIRNALTKNFFDVVLTQQFWQSPAFQFYMGDVHDVMPSTKNISSLQPINGKCKAMDDKYFNITNKGTTTYLVSLNFTCEFKVFNNTKRLIAINIAVDYQVEIVPLPSSINCVIKSITGVPTFYQQPDFTIKNMELAQYMVEQTLKMTKGSTVFGSGFKVLSRKYPRLQVRPKYLFLFDSSSKMQPTYTQSILQQPKHKKTKRLQQKLKKTYRKIKQYL